MLLTGSVSDEVRGPTEQLLDDQVAQDVQRRVSDSFLKFELPRFSHFVSINFGFLLDFTDLGLGPCLGNKDFVSGHVSGSGVVTSVGDSPRVVRYEKNRVKNPSDGVVDVLGRRKRLMTAFVGDDPETGTEETHPDRDEGVSGSSSEVVSDRRQVELCDGRINVERGPGEETERDEILYDVQGRSNGGSVEAVCRDSIEQLLDGELGRNKLFLFTWCGGSTNVGLLLFLCGGSGDKLLLFGLAWGPLSKCGGHD